MKTYTLEKQGETLIFYNPETGTGGCLNFEMVLAPGAIGPEPHIHTRQDEGFTVISGTLVVTIDGSPRTLHAYDEVIVKAGQAHSFRNGSDTDPVSVRCYADPALGLYWFLSEAAKLAIVRGGSWKDLPLPEASWLLYNLRDEYRLAGIPFILQNILFGTLATVARITGRTRKIAPKPV
jgi:quercetin dioxygenase-like cupin family protein